MTEQPARFVVRDENHEVYRTDDWDLAFGYRAAWNVAHLFPEGGGEPPLCQVYAVSESGELQLLDRVGMLETLVGAVGPT